MNLSRVELSATVDLVPNGVWERLECSGCGRKVHGPCGAALPLEEQDKFLITHRGCRGA